MANEQSQKAMIEKLSNQVISLAAEWSIMKNEFEDIKAMNAIREKKLDEILSILQNNEVFGSVGMVAQVRQNTVAISEWKTKTKAYIAVAAILLPIIVWVAEKILIK